MVRPLVEENEKNSSGKQKRIDLTHFPGERVFIIATASSKTTSPGTSQQARV
jgi:hypothetical protein